MQSMHYVNKTNNECLPEIWVAATQTQLISTGVMSSLHLGDANTGLNQTKQTDGNGTSDTSRHGGITCTTHAHFHASASTGSEFWCEGNDSRRVGVSDWPWRWNCPPPYIPLYPHHYHNHRWFTAASCLR